MKAIWRGAHSRHWGRLTLVALWVGVSADAQSLPVPVTLGASNVTFRTATLRGVVSPSGMSTWAWFEWWRSPEYRSKSVPIAVGDGTDQVAVNYALTNLLEGTTNYFRLVASNNAGVSFGQDLTFETQFPFAQTTAELTGVVWGMVAPADFDDDGHLDLVVCGRLASDQAAAVSKLYRNTGDGTFSEAQVPFTGLWFGSASWADHDGDDRLDLLLTGYDSNNVPQTQLYRNLGEGNFVEQDTCIPGVGYSAASWADYDRDGRPDLLLSGYMDPYEARPTGEPGTNPVTLLYRNLGGGVFADVPAPVIGPGTTNALPAVGGGTVTWSDLNSDGWPDFFLSGLRSSEVPMDTRTALVYTNRGDGTFAVAQTMFGEAVIRGSADVADYNNDGYPEVLVTGWSYSSFPPGTWVLANGSGHQLHPLPTAPLAGVREGAGVWGDYDHDGYADLLITGENVMAAPTGYVSVARTCLYHNNRQGTVTPLSDALPPLTGSAAAWGDFDGDGRLDFVLAGSVATGSPPICRVYRNVGPATNTPPDRPGIWAHSSLVPGYVALNWNSGDRETPQRGLSYSLRLGVTSGGSEIIRPASNEDGSLWLPRRGNMEQAVGLVLHGVAPGTYYWSVQAIDAGLGASAFADEQVLVVEAPRILWFSARTNGGLCFEFIGDPVLNYVVMASTDLRGWATVGVAQAFGPPWFRFCDTSASNEPVRFYRLRTP